MERMGSFRSRHAKSIPVKNTAQASNSNNNDNAGSSSNIAANAVANSSGADAERRVPQPACMVREQDQYMPIANVIRIMRRILPPHAKISDDAKETMQECVSEYISFITGEANERCQREQRKTVTAEDVLWAMGKLGFDNYVDPLTMFLNRYREVETDRGSTRGDMSFVRRELRALNHGGPAPPQVGMMGPPLPPPPFGPMGFPMGPPPPPHPGMFEAMAGYFRDGSGAGGAGAGASSSSSHQNQNALGAFDPFAQFK